MAEKEWFVAALSGLGEIAFWVDDEELNKALKSGDRLEVENPTQVITTPQGAMFRPLADKTTILPPLIGLYHPAPKGMDEDLSRMWDGHPLNGKSKTIQLPTQSERGRFGG